MLDQGILDRAKFCALVELFHDDDDIRKAGAVSQALLDVMDYIIESGTLSPKSELPEELRPILARSVAFLGDPF